MTPRRGLAFAAIVGTLTFAGAAAAGFGTGANVRAVEGQQFSGTVATYTSTVTASQRFIGQAYLDLLGRTPSPAELWGFYTFLAKGGTDAQVAHTLLGSDEYRARLAGSVYQTYLRRPAGPSEVAAATALLGAGATDEQLKAQVLGSAEYLAVQGGGTVHGFLNALYLDVLGRPIDPAAEALFSQQLAQSATREQVALAVLTSLEARQDLVEALYQRFLHRAPTASELQAATGLLSNGGSDADVIALLVGSPEYFQSVPASFASATIDWGDGSPSSNVPVPAGSVVGSHTYAEEGSYAVSVVVHDLDGSVTIGGTATVSDAPLSAQAMSFSVSKKTAFTRTVASFTDADPNGAASDFTATIAWGDGKSSAGTVTAARGGGFGVSGSHTYAAKRSYTVTVHIADVGGSSAEATATAHVTAK
jgi:NAD(P)H-dependent FMN reductase